MKKLKNVLYVVSENAKLHVKNKSVAVSTNDGKDITIPAHTLEFIVCFGDMSVTTPFISFCCSNEILLNFMSPHGRFYGRVVAPTHGNILLRRNHFKMIEDESIALFVSKNIIKTKISNSKHTLSKFGSRTNNALIENKISNICIELDKLKNKIENSESKDELRGYEGVASTLYFSVFDDLLKEDSMKFEKRTRRPPENKFNALLSFIYTLLTNDMESALETVGLDVQAGFLHCLRSGRPALAIDIIEELRSPLGDRMAIGLVNTKQIKETDFEETENGIFLTKEARKKVINAWQDRKTEEIFHPYFNEKIEIGLLPYAQAQILARFIRGDEEEYKPFLWR